MGVTLGGLNIKSRQAGITSINNLATVNETLTAVNPAKCQVSLLGWSTSWNVNTYQLNAAPKLYLSNATTLQITRNNSSADYGYVSWEVVEFY